MLFSRLLTEPFDGFPAVSTQGDEQHDGAGQRIYDGNRRNEMKKASKKLNRNQLIKLGFLLLLIAVITPLHYLTGTEHSQIHGIYRRLYYLPVILAGIWFCLRGGIGIALLVSVLYAPHVLFQWGNVPPVNVEQYLEILLYNTIGFLTGFLSAKEQAQRQCAEQHAERLSTSYAKLREQADLILEIEDQLRRADRLTALGELSAGMAHEIRNPLGSIRGTAEILRDAFPPEDRYAEFTKILIDETDRLNHVLENFLQFAHSESGEREDFKPEEVLLNVLQLCQKQAGDNQVSMTWEKQALPTAVGDANQFKQVFLNLVLNAIQAMPTGGKLCITGMVKNDQILLFFEDTGPGIPEEHLERIFNPFFTTKTEGTGLGLSITHRIVQNHGGQIRVQNTPEGGAEFVLILQSSAHQTQEMTTD
jgi:signal transduction histidine kinase